MRSLAPHALLIVLPWGLRRRLLERFFGYQIHPTARIGLSLVAPQRLVMGPGSTIGHLNVVRGMDLLEMGPGCGISKLNWIYGSPPGNVALAHVERKSELIFEEGAGITSRHLIDCSDTIRLGRFTSLIGYGTQILTHQLDLRTAEQSSAPVTLGSHCMVATRCTILAGATLPDRSVLAAGSTLRGDHVEPNRLYSGVPAKPVAEPLDAELGWFKDENHVSAQRIRAATAESDSP